jgi:DNA polymerase/3'-5' exonuclease PolX
MDLAVGQTLACQLLDMLAPVTTRRQVVGSIRRRAPIVGDIEILVAPLLEVGEVNLFGDPTAYRDLLEGFCRDQLRDGVFSHRLAVDGKRADGGKYKRLWFAPSAALRAGSVAFEPRVRLDLFICRPAALHGDKAQEWGVLEALRTGPAEFSRRLVTQRIDGGLLPFGMRVADGVLWRGNTRIETPDERAFFAAIGVDYIEPGDRR